MAEQGSRNVVENSLSTSGSPPVDVSADHTTEVPASFGSNTHSTLHTEHQSSNEVAERSTQDVSELLSTITTLYGPSAPAKATPSAGSAAAVSADVPETADESIVGESEAASRNQVDGFLSEVSNLEAMRTDGGKTPDGSVDISIGSDTENTRIDALDQKRDEKFHARTNSMKKPAIFSKVAVTKNFMAKTATSIPATPKPGDKSAAAGVAPAQPSIAKPRLIAKTGSSLRDIQKARLGTGNSGGPDASKVWNKNRPAGPPAQKQFTDEELKQQYGIHLATRLQTDENDKEAKWADIDDDEDDWAPEAVVWMDGTKSTLTPQETPVAQKDMKPATPQPTKVVDSVKAPALVIKPSEPGPQKTILKPGLNAAAAQQAKQSGTAPGSTAEKPLLKAKSPAPLPVKSPWAPLPPVEKISPINPPVQAPPQRLLVSGDARLAQGARVPEPTLPPQPVREIATDTFDRSWRENEGGSRELFNSANGRYEQVLDNRRGSQKLERKSLVLQRPSHSTLPAVEGSLVDQTAVTDLQGARRRGSSVSHGSGPPDRRLSMSKPSELPVTAERRGSILAAQDARSAQQTPREPGQPAFNRESAWQRQMPAQPAVDEELADPVKAQERIMREKIAIARKRRQEEEDRAEAEKQERLKARLASLQGAGKSRKEREAEAAASAVSAPTSAEPSDPKITPTTTFSVETASPEKATAQTSEENNAKPEPAVAPKEAPVQAAKIDATPVDTRQKPLDTTTATHAPMQEQIATATDNDRQQARVTPSPNAAPRNAFQPQGPAYRAPPSSYSSPGERKQQPYARQARPNEDAVFPWPASTPNSNVWGNSGIGNGTFESSNVFSTLPASSSLPPPPGMSRPQTSSRISPQSVGKQEARSPAAQHSSTTDTTRTLPPPGLDSLPDSFADQLRGNGASPAPVLSRQSHVPGPIAPPSRAPQQQPQSQRLDALSAWNKAAQQLPYQYKLEVEAAERRRDEESAPAEPSVTIIKETFKQRHIGRAMDAHRAEYGLPEASTGVPHKPIAPHLQMRPPPLASTQASAQENIWSASKNPSPALDTELLAKIQQPSGPSPVNYSSTPPALGQINFQTGPLPRMPSTDNSPPPPEEAGHPVNSGDASHPLVKLPPGSKPKVVVRLPPAPSTPMIPHQFTAVTMPPRPMGGRGPTGAMTPLVANVTWQARFNGLFNRTSIHTETPPSPPKTPPKAQGPALAVASSSKTVMEEARNTKAATVSLPQRGRQFTREGFVIDNSKDVFSKPTVDYMFNEERNFGSRPKVFVPRRPAYSAVVYTPTKIDLLKYSPSYPMETQQFGHSRLEFNLWEIHTKRNDGYFVHMPARIAKLNKVLAKFNSTNRHQGHRGSYEYKRGLNHAQRGKGKDVPAVTLSHEAVKNVRGYAKSYASTKFSKPTTAGPLASTERAAKDSPPAARQAPTRAHPRKVSQQLKTA